MRCVLQVDLSSRSASQLVVPCFCRLCLAYSTVAVVILHTIITVPARHRLPTQGFLAVFFARTYLEKWVHVRSLTVSYMCMSSYLPTLPVYLSFFQLIDLSISSCPSSGLSLPASSNVHTFARRLVLSLTSRQVVGCSTSIFNRTPFALASRCGKKVAVGFTLLFLPVAPTTRQYGGAPCRGCCRSGRCCCCCCCCCCCWCCCCCCFVVAIVMLAPEQEDILAYSCSGSWSSPLVVLLCLCSREVVLCPLLAQVICCSFLLFS